MGPNAPGGVGGFRLSCPSDWHDVIDQWLKRVQGLLEDVDVLLSRDQGDEEGDPMDVD
jgi:hypothetical protein